MAGLAEEQTERLNLLNPGVAAPALGVVCSAAVTYLDGDGNVLKTASLSVLPGKSAAVDQHSDTYLSLAAGERREIRAIIAIPAVPPPPTAGSTPIPAACELIPTLEIVDSVSGRTQFVLGRVETVQ